MIASLRGILLQKSPTEITVDVHGIGYGLQIPLSTFEALGDVNSPVTLFTFLHVREDALQLYGFATDEERSMFRLLISVSGIGPRMAQGILSGIPVGELRAHLAQGNLAALTAIPGVGRKLGERLIVELREKLSRMEPAPAGAASSADRQGRTRSEALMAMISLGYSRVAAEKALQAAIRETDGRDIPVEELIKTSLRHAARS